MYLVQNHLSCPQLLDFSSSYLLASLGSTLTENNTGSTATNFSLFATSHFVFKYYPEKTLERSTIMSKYVAALTADWPEKGWMICPTLKNGRPITQMRIGWNTQCRYHAVVRLLTASKQKKRNISLKFGSCVSRFSSVPPLKKLTGHQKISYFNFNLSLQQNQNTAQKLL